jgi:hypothetical protein
MSKVEWTQTATIVAVLAAAIGLQSFWIARALDALRSEMHRGFDTQGQRLDRLEARLDRIGPGKPPSLRRV